MIRIKRAYDPPSPEDGKRVLVDRLWPRGLRKDAAHIDEWLKELAPSHDLRRWFGHDPAKFEEFERRYEVELQQHRDLLERIRSEAARGSVTLLYAARDTEHNNAVVLRGILSGR